jgi:glycerol-3-phosphate dehydrogenase (NAD(P)+)
LQKVAILGAGAWGSALAILLAKNGHAVTLWTNEDGHCQQLRNTQQNERFLPGFELGSNISFEDQLNFISEYEEVIIAVPSEVFREVLARIKQFFTKNPKIVWVTKGLDPKGKFLDQVVEEIFGPIPMACLSGPTFAFEVAKGLPTAITLASNDSSFAKKIADLFHSESFRVYTSDDLVGVEIGGAIKNVLAIGVGIADGMNFGANARAALITRGLAELSRFGVAFGGRQETFFGLSGVGDLVLTCTDNQSRNRRFGILLGQGKDIESARKKINGVIEGIPNAQIIHQLALNKKVEMPITEQVFSILYQNKSPQQAVSDILRRAKKDERS